MLQRRPELLRVVLQIPTIASQRERQARVSQQLFRGRVLSRERERRAIRVQDAGVSHELHPHTLGRVADYAMLLHAPPDLTR